MPDLKQFLEEHKNEHVRVSKPVKLEHIGALTAEANDSIVFENIEGFAGYTVVDQLFSNRKAQARVLGCEPKDVVRVLAEILQRGPKPLKEVEGELTDTRLVQTFTEGMYACLPPGMEHGPFKSDAGCLMFEIRYYK
jgi:3-polyprenyl-4-hydroxybenzoate decarboxylase